MIGLAVIPAILLAGVPDRTADARAGKRTLVVRLGTEGATRLALALVPLSALGAVVLALVAPHVGVTLVLGVVPHAAVLVWLLVRYLRSGVADTLDAVTAPVALISAAQDTIVPARRTEPVRRSVRDLILDRVILGAGHNDLYDRAEFKLAMREALSLIENASGRKRTPPG